MMKKHLFGIFMSFALILSACSSTTSKPAAATISSPVSGAPIKVGDSVAINGIATGTNIAKVDIYVNGQLYASQTTPDAAVTVSEFKLAQTPWVPRTNGTHVIQLRAYNNKNELVVQSEPLVVTAAGEPTAIPKPAAQPTPAPAAVQPTVAATPTPATATLTVANDFARVRSGPGTAYQALGQINQNETAKVTGRNDDSTWWQIDYKGTPGWVFGELVKVNDAAKAVKVAVAPPAPTAPPLPTVSIASLPTAPPPVPVAQSGTGAKGLLRVDKTTTQLNGTVNASWSVSDAREVFFDSGDGGGYRAAGGTMSVPVNGISGSRTLRLKVTYNNGSVVEDAIDVRPDSALGSAPSSASTGSRGILRVDRTVGSTINVSWNVSDAKEILFDSGDGSGFHPGAGNMSFGVNGISSARTFRLKITYNNGSVVEDTVDVRGDGTASSSSSSGDCNASDPNWRGGNPVYPFCVGKDLGWVGLSDSSVQRFPHGTDKDITVSWNFYGIAGLQLAADPSSQQTNNCGPAAPGGWRRDVNGNGSYTFNIKNWDKGQYKLEMFVKLRDGKEVGHNEIFLCIQ